MSWFSRIFGDKSHKQDDPIIARCKSVVDSMNLELNANEWSSVNMNRDLLASSPLGGAFIHKDVFHVLCYLCVYDGLFERSLELIDKGDHIEALLSLEKVIKLLSWPTATYACGLCYENIGKKDDAINKYRTTIRYYQDRKKLLSNLIPESTPARDDLIEQTENRLDRSGAILLGHINIEELIIVANNKIT